MAKETVVAVTEREYNKASEVFDAGVDGRYRCVPAPGEERALAAAIREAGARHAVVGVDRYGGVLYESLPRGGVVARFGVGYDGLDLERATGAGLLCTNTPGVLDQSVAEHAMALLLCAARHVVRGHIEVLAGGWFPALGLEVAGLRLAVIGCGAIGCRVARIASRGFDMEVVGCEVREVNEEEMKQGYGFVRVVQAFEEAVRDADFVSLHIPSVPETQHFVNRDRLAGVPARAWLINTARGAIVDERALHRSLQRGEIAGACLDVFETEPYAPPSPGEDLRALPNVVMTPHVGSTTAQAGARMSERALRNIALAEEGHFSDMDLLNPAVLPALS